MFGNKKVEKEVIKASLSDMDSRITTILAEDMTLKDGNLHGSSSFKISGTFFGDVDIGGVLIVSGSGKLHGNVKAEAAYIHGAIEGNVAVKGKAHIYPAGRLLGDFSGSSLVADDGATFHGQSNITASIFNSKEEKLDRRNDATSEPEKE